MAATIAARVPARRRASGAASQPASAAGELRRRRPGRARTTASAAPAPGPRAASVRATSPRPGVVGHDRQRAAGGRLGGDHPERLGERARAPPSPRTAGSRSASSSWSRRPATADALGAARRGGAVGGGPLASRRARNAASCGELRAPSSRAGRRRRLQVAGGQRGGERAPGPSRNAPKPTTPAAPRARAASTSGQAASSSSTPLEAISLPTKTTRRSAGSTVGERGRGLAGVARERRAVPARPARARRPARRAARSRPARAASGSRGAKRSTSTPGGPSRVRAGSAGSSIAAHRLSAVWREPTSTPRAPASPSAAYGAEARMRLDHVLQRAAVDLDRVRDAVRARGRGSPGPSRGGWRARRPAARARPPRARRRRCARGSGRARRRRARGTAAPRRPRSGRRRRAAAARRCPGR